jgi:hypothetical protein
MVQDHPYSLFNSSIRGLWAMRGNKVYAFSATSTSAIERLVSKIIEVPDYLRCLSEYEHAKG